MILYPGQSYFTTEELECPCQCGFGSKQGHIDENLIDTLNMIRMLYGKPMVVTSGARCEEYNHEKGGLPNSAHLPHDITHQCRAVDIAVNNSSDRFDLVQLALNAGVTRFGIGPNFLHMDVAWDLPDPVMFNY